MPETKPVVIRIEDGQRVNVIVATAGKGARIQLEADLALTETGRHLVHIYGMSGRIGEVPLTPDPIRAAVLAERERCKAAFRAAMEEHHYAASTIDHVVDAIDAPDKTDEPADELIETVRADAHRYMWRACVDIVTQLKKIGDRVAVESVLIALRGLNPDADARAETVSEYERGGEAFRERAKECARSWPYTVLRPGLLEKLDAIPGVTEPPR